MSRYLLQHRHEPHECGVVFAAFKDPEPASPQSDAGLVPLRRARDLVDGHADTEEEALELLPYYVAERTTVSRVSEVEIP